MSVPHRTAPPQRLGLQTAARVLAAQPFSALLGTRITAFAEARAVLELDVTPHLLQQHGVVHGGVLAYLVDNAVTFAAGTVLGPDLVTSGIVVEYLRPARGPTLRAEATVVSRTRSLAVMRCDVLDDDSTARLVAVGQGRASLRGEQPARPHEEQAGPRPPARSTVR